MGTSKSKIQLIDKFIPVKDLQNIILEYDIRLPYLKELKSRKKLKYKKNDLCLMRQVNVNDERYYFITEKIPNICYFWKSRESETDRILYLIATQSINRVLANHWMYYKKEDVIPEDLDIFM